MKTLISNYTFDASAKTITFNDYVSITLENILIITNVTDNIIIYNFAIPGKGGSVATNVVTLGYDTTSMSDADDLQIWYDDPDIQPIQDGGNVNSNGQNIATQTTLAAINTALQSGGISQTQFAAMVTALQLIDNIVSGTGVNISQINGVTPLMGAGNTGTGSHRVTIATNDVNLSAIKTAIEILDNIVSGNEAQVDIVASLPAGTNAIGKLAANSGVDIGDVDVTSQPARDRTTDNQGVALQTDAIMSDTTVLTPKFAVISAATSGNNTLVAAVASKKIRVLSYHFVVAGDVNVRFESGAGGTALTGIMSYLANTGEVQNFSPLGHFETGVNTLLNLELSGAVQVSGSLVYVEV